jgi:hypothetical protein
MSHRLQGSPGLIVLLISLLLSACGAQRSDELGRLFRDNQSKLIQCQVDLTNASRDADLSRGQREVAEQKADQAAQSRLAVEHENTALRQELKELKSQQARRAPSAALPALGPDSPEVTRSLTKRQLFSLISAESTEAKRLKNGVLAVFGKLKSQILYNAKNHVLASIAHFSGFHIDLNYVNRWNREHRFGRLYLDQDGDVVVEAELDLEPGVRQEALRAWVRNYGVLINLLNRELIEQERQQRRSRGAGGERDKPRGQQM